MGEANQCGTKPQRIGAAMEAKGVKYDLLIIYVSDSQEGPWTPIHSNDVPDWLKNNMQAMGQLAVFGRMCCHDFDEDGEPTGPWYRAERANKPQGVIVH